MSRDGHRSRLVLLTAVASESMVRYRRDVTGVDRRLAHMRSRKWQ